MGLGTLAMWPCLKISSSDFCVFFCGKNISNFETYPPGVAKLCCKITWQQIFYLKSRSCFFLSFTWHFPATFKRQAVRQDVFFLCAFLNASCLLHNQQQLQQVNHLAWRNSKEPVPFARSFWHHVGVLKRCSRIWPLSLLGNLACTSDSNPHYFQEFADVDALLWFLCCTGHGEIPHPHGCIMFENLRFFFFGRRNLILDAVSDDFWMMLVCYQEKSLRRPEHHGISSWSFFSSTEISSVQLLGPFCWVLHWTLQQESPPYNWFRNSCHQLRYCI